jgi:hypothetical protein
MSTTFISFYFVDFLIGKVSLSFKDIKGDLSLYFLIYSFTLTNIFFDISFYFVDFLIGKVSLSFKDIKGDLSLYFLIYSFTLTNIFFDLTVGSS